MDAKTLSILVPIFNEARTLKQVMDRIVAVCPLAQVIYIDDGSKDDSLQILQANVRALDIVLTKENGGKGSAILLGLTKATGRYTVIQDADLEYEPAQILDLLSVAEAHPGSAVFGSRFLQKNPTSHWRFLLGNKVITFALRILFGGHISDSYTCYKLLPTELFRSLPLQSRGYELEAEISAWCLKKKIPVLDVPILYRPRTVEEGKKIRWHDAVKGLKTMIRIRFS